MSSLNRVTLIGNIGNEPEIRATNDGREIASFSIATSESWKDKHSGERKEKTEWHRIVIFSEALAKIARDYLHKGSKVLVEGQLQTRKWTDNSGIERYSTEVVLQGFGAMLKMLDGKRDGGGGRSNDDDRGSRSSGGHGGRTVISEGSGPIPDLDDEIPF